MKFFNFQFNTTFTMNFLNIKHLCFKCNQIESFPSRKTCHPTDRFTNQVCIATHSTCNS